jgi:Domain of unknown function (DUF4383)
MPNPKAWPMPKVQPKESRMNNNYTPASLYAALIGGVLLLAGVVGFFYSASFGSPGSVDAVFGVLDVNAWHNLIHIASGALGLLAFSLGPRASRTYALAFGLVYVVVAAWGLILGNHESILGFIPINTEDNILGVLGVGAYLASDPERQPAPRERRAA